MAEMNDMYKKDFDLAGFSVGVVEKSAIIDGSKISVGDTIYALLVEFIAMDIRWSERFAHLT